MSVGVPRDSNPEILSLRRMAARLGVTSAWLRDQAETGAVPGLRAGNRWLFAPDAVWHAVREMAEKKGGDR